MVYFTARLVSQTVQPTWSNCDSQATCLSFELLVLRTGRTLGDTFFLQMD